MCVTFASDLTCPSLAEGAQFEVAHEVLARGEQDGRDPMYRAWTAGKREVTPITRFG